MAKDNGTTNGGLNAPMSLEDEIEMLEQKFSKKTSKSAKAKKKAEEEVVDSQEETIKEDALEVASEPEVVEEKPTQKRARKHVQKVEKIEIETEDVDVDVNVGEDDVEDDNESFDDEPKAQKKKKKGEGKRGAKSEETVTCLEDLTKANVWTIDEQQLFDMYNDGKHRDSFSENETHYMNLIRPVFEFKFFNKNDRDKTAEFEEQGYYVFPIHSTNTANALAIRRRPIKKITDLTLENIYHVEPKRLLELIDDNMGTGWQGLPLYLQDIILAGFYVDCSVMPEMALHRPGGIIERRIADGYEVLEIARGTWIEAVFVKVKPKSEKAHFEPISDKPIKKRRERDDDDEEDYDEEDEESEDDNLDDEEDEVEEQDEDNPNLEDIDTFSSDDEDDD